MAECRGPSFKTYVAADALKCMQLMDLVLWNRLANNPKQFAAAGAKTIVDIIKAPGQFAGFETCPNYSAGIASTLQQILDIANNPKDKRGALFTEFVQNAIDVANNATISDPSPGFMAGWRTAGASSPGSAFTKHTTVGGNDFYFLP
jgi:hypothetical protein